MKKRKEKMRLVASHDYGPAVRSAVSWLGDRYLLAQPVRRREESGKTFFVEARGWHPGARH